MFDVLKQSVFTSIALAGMTREKVSDVVAEVAKQAKLSEQQAREFQEEVSRRSDQARKELTEQIDHQIDHALIQLGLVKSEARKTAETVNDSLKALIDSRIDEALKRLSVARSEDLAALDGRLKLMEDKLNT